MNSIFKNVFLSVGIFLFIFGMFGFVSNKAEAATITSAGSGIWNLGATWVGGVIPIAGSDVVIAAGHTVTLAADQTITAIDSLTINGTGVLTNAATSAIVIPTVVVEGTLTNTGVLSIGTALSGAGALTNTGTLNLAGTSTITTLTAGGGGTVNYTQTGAPQTVLPTTYSNLGISGDGVKTMTGVTTVSGNFTMSGSVTATPVITTIGGNLNIAGDAEMTTGADNVVTGTLSVAGGAHLHMGGFALTIGSTSDITGTVDTVVVGTGTKTFTGGVTLNTGAIWDLTTTDPATSFGGGITAGTGATTFNNGTGVATFSASQALGGTEDMTFGSDINISSGTLTNSNTGIVTVAGSITGNFTQGSNSNLTLTGNTPFVSGTFTSSATGNLVTYTGTDVAIKAVTYNNLTINGGGTATIGTATIVNGTMTVTSAVTNNSTLTVTTALSGGSTLTNGADATLNIGGTSGITGLTATATGNTVNYTEAGAQTVFPTAYRNLGISGSGLKTMTGVTTLTGNFSMSGSVTATPVLTTIGGNLNIGGTSVMTTGATNTVTGTLTVGSGATLTMGDFALTIGSTSDITGTVNTSGGLTGLRTFTGAVTINSGGVWNLSGQNPATSFANGITMNGTTFNNGTGAAAFGANQNLAGSAVMTFGGTLTPAGGTTLTNTNTGGVTVASTGSIVLTGNFTQGSNSILTLAANTPLSGSGVFTSSASGNLVTYTGTSVAIKAGTYNNLTINGGGTATIGGATTVNGTMTVSSAVTNNSTLTVTTSLTGTNTLTNAGTLNIGQSSMPLASGTLVTTAGDVDYTAASPTCKVTTYNNLTFSGSGTVTCAAISITGDLILGGTVSLAPSGASLTIGDALTVGSGTTFSMPGIAVTITGATGVTGILSTVTAATGTKTFTGAVTVNDGGVWNLSVTNPAVFLAGGFTVNGAGTFTSGSGNYTFQTNAQTLGGARAITISNITNNITSGSGLSLEDAGATITTLTQGTGSVLTFAGAIPTITTLDADTNANTVVYTGASQAIKADTYSSLTVNGSGTATVDGVTIVNGTMTVTSAVTNNSTLTVTTALSGASTLTNAANATLNIGGTSGITGLTATATGNTVNYTGADQTVKNPGTTVDYANLGLSGSGAKALAADTDMSGNFYITANAKATLSGTSNTADKLYFGNSQQYRGTWGSSIAHGSHQSDTYFTAANALISITTGDYYRGGSSGGSSSPRTVVPVVPVVATASGCSGGNLFNTSTGAACTNNTGITSPKRLYALGTVTLKNGSRGEAVKELQRFLNDKLKLGLVVDGKLGPKTIAVMKKWQKDNGLLVDGLIGPKTKAMINK